MRVPRDSFACWAVAVCLLAGPAEAGITELPSAPDEVLPARTKIDADDAAPGDFFGCAAALNGATVLVGSLLDDDRGQESGSAYFFRFADGAWRPGDKVTGFETAAGDQFGFAVALGSDLAAIGAPFADAAAPSAGAVHLFVQEAGEWFEEARLTPGEGSQGAEFGSAVAVEDERVVVGAPRQDDARGAVYVFERQNGLWQPLAAIAPGDVRRGDLFGRSVALDGDVLVAGAPFDDDRGTNSGSVYVFRRQGQAWIQEAKLTAPDGVPFDAFGYTVAVDGDRLAVGAPLNDAAGGSAGAAYLFRRTAEGWQPEVRLEPSQIASGDQLGIAVDVAAEVVAVGARRADDAAGADVGAAYLFRLQEGEWMQEARLLAPDGQAGDELGLGLSLGDGVLLVGAFLDDDGGEDAGSVYLFAPEADLTVDKTRTEPEVVPGLAVEYLIEVANQGPSDLAAVRVRDSLPAGLSQASWSCSGESGGECSPQGTGGIDESVLLPAGGSVAFRLTAQVPAGAVGALENTATAEPPPGVRDPTPGDNSATDTAVLVPRAGLSVSKESDQAVLVPGGQVDYTIDLVNGGPSDVAGVRVLDNLPPGLLGGSWSCNGFVGASCSPAGTGDIDDRVDLPAGGAVSYRLSATVASSLVGPVVNRVCVYAPAGVAAAATSPSARLLTVAGAATAAAGELAGTMSVSGDLREGGTAVYSVVLRNGLDRTQYDNPQDELVDALPLTLQLVAAIADRGTVTFDPAQNFVAWNGNLCPLEEARIEIQAVIEPGTVGQVISNQGLISFDADGDGTNESTGVTSDPNAPEPGAPTTFQVAPAGANSRRRGGRP